MYSARCAMIIPTRPFLISPGIELPGDGVALVLAQPRQALALRQVLAQQPSAFSLLPRSREWYGRAK